MNDYPTALGASSRESITLLGKDAARRPAGRACSRPWGFQLEYARRLGHMAMPYPDIAT